MTSHHMEPSSSPARPLPYLGPSLLSASALGRGPGCALLVGAVLLGGGGGRPSNPSEIQSQLIRHESMIPLERHSQSGAT